MDNPLKKYSVEEIQTAIAGAISKLVGHECAIQISGVEFLKGQVPFRTKSAEITMKVDIDPPKNASGPTPF